MREYRSYGNYDIHPVTAVHGYDDVVIRGYGNIRDILQERLDKKPSLKAAIDIYPGVDEERLVREFGSLSFSRIVMTSDFRLPDEKMDEVFESSLSDDRVFGVMTHKDISDCFDSEAVENIRKYEDSLLIIGVGAALFTEPDIILYFDITRWEIQLRYRAGKGNWMVHNPDDPQLSKYKRGFFIEWRLADKHKDAIIDSVDYMVDTENPDDPRMIGLDAFRSAFSQASHKPFRMVPYFDPGVWGGQWMKNIFGLDTSQKNYAWSFDGVPEENAICFSFGGETITFPMMDMTLFEPVPFLGSRNVARFGREFPIRFDLLDTMEGGNLSLQVHPLTEYIQKTFGMHYTQDESYYILDASENSCVYIGLKDGVDKNEMEAALREAQRGGKPFDAEKYVNRIPVKKHDHILIPAGTIHCSGADTMVLEVSATPYIFTFKLWDWGRIGLDGLPRPIHIDHGMKNIQFSRTTEWVKENLIDVFEVVHEDENLLVERTGLHSLEFIETLRYKSRKPFEVVQKNGVHVLNLVDGKSARIESFNGSFEPFEVHYAETFIVPASVGKYRVVPDDGEEIMLLCASVEY